MVKRSLKPSAVVRSLAILMAVAGVALTVAFERGSLAQGNEIQQRQDAMSELGDIAKELNDRTKNDSDYDAARVAELAARAHEITGGLGPLFPEGSTSGDSDALPVIWENWDEFVEYATNVHEETGRLAEIARNGASRAEARAQFARVGRNCSGCHDTFRAE